MNRHMTFALSMMTMVGCIQYTTSVISFRNRNTTPAVVKLIATDPSEKPILRKAYNVPAATATSKGEDDKQASKPASSSAAVTDGTSQTPTLRVARNGRIKLEYQPNGSSAWLPMDEIVVPDSNQPVDSIYSIPSLDSLNEVTSTNQLQLIATQLGAQGQEAAGKLVDTVPLLTKLIIAKKQPDGKYSVITSVPLQTPPKLEHHEPTVIKQRIYSTREIVGSVKVNVPIYGNLEANMNSNAVYSMNVDIKHYEYINGFDLTTALSQLLSDPIKLRTIKTVLDKIHEKNPTAVALTVDRFHVIDSAVFALQRGVKLGGGTNASVLAVLTTNGTFAFSQGEESTVSMAQDVLNVRYNEFGTAADVSSAIDALLQSKDKTTLKLKSSVVQPQYQFSQELVTDR